jgi:cholesterol transport system auxiliary component
MRRYLILVSIVLSVAACSVFSPIKTETTNTYVLSSTPSVTAKKSPRAGTVLVNYPQSNAIYNTTQMAYSNERFSIAYFSKNQWADTPPQMLMPLLAKTLQSTHYFRGVMTPGMLGHFDYVLDTQLLRIQQVFLAQSSYVEIVLKAQLIRTADNKIMASKDFSAQENAFPTPYGGVIAMNKAVSTLLTEVADFVSK